MALPDFTMRQLLEAGVHFGHQTHRWNPKMAPYIFGERSNIHILDLSQTVPLLHQALVKVREVSSSGGRILFVGTKRAASDVVAESAKRCAQYYVNHRWLGGMLTNWTTISKSISHLRSLEGKLDTEEDIGLTKKELLQLTREREKLDKALGGIKDMGGTPDLIVVIDTIKESIAIQEARKLGIPVVAILDSNCDPDNADYPIPGNDDAARAIQLYCDLMADAVLDGLANSAIGQGIDLGASANPVELAAEDAKAMAAPAKEETPAKEEAKPEPKAEPKADVKDDISLIDGVGPTYKKRLEEAGYKTFASIAAVKGEEAGNKLDEELNLGGKFVSGEWADQAQELLDGKPPRAKSDAERA